MTGALSTSRRTSRIIMCLRVCAWALLICSCAIEPGIAKEPRYFVLNLIVDTGAGPVQVNHRWHCKQVRSFSEGSMSWVLRWQSSSPAVIVKSISDRSAIALRLPLNCDAPVNEEQFYPSIAVINKMDHPEVIDFYPGRVRPIWLPGSSSQAVRSGRITYSSSESADTVETPREQALREMLVKSFARSEYFGNTFQAVVAWAIPEKVWGNSPLVASWLNERTTLSVVQLGGSLQLDDRARELISSAELGYDGSSWIPTTLGNRPVRFRLRPRIENVSIKGTSVRMSPGRYVDVYDPNDRTLTRIYAVKFFLWW